jgi:hypothetical protein
MSAQPTIPLSKAIEDLRSELLTAMSQGVGRELRFRLQPIDLELELGMTWNGEANAEVKFWVIGMGAKATYEKSTTHRLKLTLEPVGPDGKSEPLITDPSARRPG